MLPFPFQWSNSHRTQPTEYGGNAGYYRGGGYHYDDRTIEGFSHMHLHGIGLTDYGVLSVMPVNQMNEEKDNKTLVTIHHSLTMMNMRNQVCIPLI